MAFKREWKEITLPVCGEKYTIRKLNGYDWSMTTGKIPNPDYLKKGAGETSLSDLKPEDIQWSVEMACRAIVESPKGLEISPKKPSKALVGVISFFELDFKDQEFLISEVFSSDEGVTGDDPARFPQKQAPGDPGLPDSKVVPEVADGGPAATA